MSVSIVSNPDDHHRSCEDRLAASNLEVERLREENEQLVKASNDFGLLAERLNSERLQDRRTGMADRRRWPRIGALTRRRPRVSARR